MSIFTHHQQFPGETQPSFQPALLSSWEPFPPMDVPFSCWTPFESCLPAPNYLKQLPNAASRHKPLWSIHFNTQHYHWLVLRERGCFCACQENNSCCIHWPPRKRGGLAIVHGIFPQGLWLMSQQAYIPKRNGFILPSALLGRSCIICSSTIINASIYTLPTENIL